MRQNATFDSSFWISAHRSGLLPRTPARFQLHFPPAVAREMREEFPSGREFWRLRRERELVEAEPKSKHMRDHGPGERAAINLALDHPGWVLLIDDRRPFVAAMRLGLHILCAPLLVVTLFHDGTLDRRQSLETMARLVAMQTISTELITPALAQLGKLLAQRREGK